MSMSSVRHRSSADPTTMAEHQQACRDTPAGRHARGTYDFGPSRSRNRRPEFADSHRIGGAEFTAPFELGLRFDKDAGGSSHVAARGYGAHGCCGTGAASSRRFRQVSCSAPTERGRVSSYEPRVISRFAADGLTLGSRVAFANRLDDDLRPLRPCGTSNGINDSAAAPSQARVSGAQGSHEYILSPDAAAGALRLSSGGHRDTPRRKRRCVSWR